MVRRLLEGNKGATTVERRQWRFPRKVGGLFALAAIAATGLTSAVAAPAASASTSGVYTIYLSNNYIENPWRVQMENYARAEANMPQYSTLRRTRCRLRSRLSKLRSGPSRTPF
jgi:hypothetical protein